MRRQSMIMLGLFTIMALSAASASVEAGEFRRNGKLPILVDQYHWIKDPAGPVSKRTLKKIDEFMKRKHMRRGGFRSGGREFGGRRLRRH